MRSSVAAFDGERGARKANFVKVPAQRIKKRSCPAFAFQCLIERFCSAPYKERRFAFTMGKPLEGLVVKGS